MWSSLYLALNLSSLYIVSGKVVFLSPVWLRTRLWLVSYPPAYLAFHILILFWGGFHRLHFLLFCSTGQVVLLVAWGNCKTGVCVQCRRSTGILLAQNGGRQIWDFWRLMMSCPWGTAFTALSTSTKDTVRRRDDWFTMTRMFRSPGYLQFSRDGTIQFWTPFSKQKFALPFFVLF